MNIKKLEKEIKEKITVLDKDELKQVIKYIDELCNDAELTHINLKEKYASLEPDSNED